MGDVTAQLETTRNGRTTAAVVVAVVLWASAFVAIRAVGHSLSPAPLALLRLAFAAAALTVLVLVKGAFRIRLSRRSFLLVGAYAVLWLAGYTVALNAGERHVDAGTAAMLVNLAPLIVAFAAGRLLGEGYSRPLIIGALVSLAGTVIIGAGATAQRDVTGVLLCLLAAALYAAGVLIQKLSLRDVDGLTAIWLGCLIATAVLLPWTPQLVGELQEAPVGAVVATAYMGVFPTAIGFTAWAYALRRMDAGRLTTTTYAVPAVSVLLSWLLLGEVPTVFGLVGGAICLAGVAISRRRG